MANLNTMSKIILSFILLMAFTAGAQSLEEISSGYLGMPYSAGTLVCAENETTNTQPDGFDCVTYVEQVLAEYLTFTGRLDMEDNLKGLRYKDSQSSCIYRNHFFIVDWLRNNPVARNITEELVKNTGMSTKTKNALIDRQAWFKAQHGIVMEREPETLQITYLPFEEALELVKVPELFPPASLVLIVNKAPSIDISHVGFLLKNGDKMIVRHASSVKKKVVDENAGDYFQNSSLNNNLLGVAVYSLII